MAQKQQRRIVEQEQLSNKIEEYALQGQPQRLPRRRRRRRNRRRRRRRPVSQAQMNNMKTVEEQYEEDHETGKGNFNNVEPPTSSMASELEEIKMAEILDGSETMKFLQATTHPFGPQGVGAIMPDSFQNNVIPGYDPLDIELDLNSIFAKINTSTDSVIIDGVIAAISPRCLAAGWFAGIQKTATVLTDDTVPVPVDVTVPDRQQIIQILPVDTNFQPLYQSGGVETPNDDYSLFDPYCLIIILVNSEGRPVAVFEDTTADPPTATLVYGAYCMRFPRIKPILSDTSAIRIIGGGAKVIARTAPINTSGVCFAGQLRIERLVKLLITDAQLPTGDTGSFKNFQNNFSNRFTTQKGVRGATARYNIFNTIDQRMKQFTNISDAIIKLAIEKIADSPMSTPGLKNGMYHQRVLKKKTRTRAMRAELKEEEEKKQVLKDITPTEAVITIYELADGIDISKDDLADPGDLIPSVYYQFNESEPIVLQLRATVHTNGEPIPTLPFLTSNVEPESQFEEIAKIAPNPQIFPLTESGNSFKSAFKKFNQITGKVLKHANVGAKILKLLETGR